MFGSLGTPEIILIVLGLLLLFGGKKIPELMKGLGSGVKEFKKASNEVHGDDDDDRPKQNDAPRIEKSSTAADDRRIEDRR